MREKKSYIKNMDIILMVFLFSLLFILPVIFSRDENGIVWRNTLKIWQDRILLLPLFLLNHWLLVPKLMLKKKYLAYLGTVIFFITSITIAYYFYDEVSGNKPIKNNLTAPERVEKKPPHQNQNKPRSPQSDQDKKPAPPKTDNKKGAPKPVVPPYADLLFLALMIVAVDTGLSFTKHWHNTEEEKARLENENIQAQLGMLRNQLNPHFFMNTLNNIYALIAEDKKRSRESVMKLSKLMRYLLYENKNGRVRISKEFDFIKNYVDLMVLRYANEVDIKLITPKAYDDIEIPSFLFISYLENAFKYGISYQQKSFIYTSFKLQDNFLLFTCENSINIFNEDQNQPGGIGLQNNRQRLDLLFDKNYDLKISKTEEVFTVNLKIPIK